ncbi:MAG: hypothetical protein ACTSU0_08370, partial [Alphaproteobacteria bacterium]
MDAKNPHQGVNIVSEFTSHGPIYGRYSTVIPCNTPETLRRGFAQTPGCHLLNVAGQAEDGSLTVGGRTED